MSDFVICNTTIIPDLVGVEKNKLRGHIISMPIQTRPDGARMNTQLRTNISQHIKLVFFNSDDAWLSAQRLTKEMNLINVRPERVELWMKSLGLTEKLDHFREHREEYLKKWKAQEEKIFADALVSDDHVALRAHRHAAADVAGARPQMNPDGEMEEPCAAVNGFSNIVLLERNAINEGEISLDSLVGAFTPGGHGGREQYKMDVDSELPNEFIVNDVIFAPAQILFNIWFHVTRGNRRVSLCVCMSVCSFGSEVVSWMDRI